MADDLTRAPCPHCHTDMVYVTAVPHQAVPGMRRTIFLCTPCNQTKTYMLSATLAEAYAATAAA